MPKQHLKANDVDEDEEVLKVGFPSGNEVCGGYCIKANSRSTFRRLLEWRSCVRPGPVLASARVGYYQLDAVLGGKLFIERVQVVGFVANELNVSRGSSRQGPLPQAGTRTDRAPWRETARGRLYISGNSDDLAALAAAEGRATEKVLLSRL
jgi:hypothetical protein